METTNTYTAFSGTERIASGELADNAVAMKARADAGDEHLLTLFDDSSGRTIELDLRGSTEDVLSRLPRSVEEPTPEEQARGKAARPEWRAKPAERRGPGRPKLGVVGREVTLLPRHWEWLATQPGGASVALRKLVEQARRDSAGKDRVRQAQEAAYRFMTTLAGDEAGYEEATRALFAGDRRRFEAHSQSWPRDVRDYALELAAPALAEGGAR